ncbi:MAG: response regulator [Candidatus Competibacterales bacterium]
MDVKPTVLFVDDERHVTLSLRVLFRNQYRVLTANSGREALEILRREPVQVLVSDQRMPAMTGAELLSQARQVSPTTMRLLLTGFSDLSAIISSINDGEVFRFINKPWDNDELRAIIDQAMAIALETEVPPGPAVDEGEVQDPAAAVSSQVATPAAPPLAKEPSPAADPAFHVLGIDDDPTVAQRLQQALGFAAWVEQRADLDGALHVLEEVPVAVVVADIAVNGGDVTDFVKLLKAEHPLVMTIVHTAAMDSEEAIGLINQGQIFRYLYKPASDAVLTSSVVQGFQFYQRLRRQPQGLKRHTVAATRPGQRSIFQRLMDRLKTIRQRHGPPDPQRPWR